MVAVSLGASAGEKFDLKKASEAMVEAQNMHEACVRVWAKTLAASRESSSDVADVTLEKCAREAHEIWSATMTLVGRGQTTTAAMQAGREAEEFARKKGRNSALLAVFEARYPELKCCSLPLPDSPSR
jgi:hypothetical protein